MLKTQVFLNKKDMKKIVTTTKDFKNILQGIKPEKVRTNMAIHEVAT